MNTRLLNLWEKVHTSFWFIPGLMIVLATGLSHVMVSVDRKVEPEHLRVFGLPYTGGPEGARFSRHTGAGPVSSCRNSLKSWIPALVRIVSENDKTGPFVISIMAVVLGALIGIAAHFWKAS